MIMTSFSSVRDRKGKVTKVVLGLAGKVGGHLVAGYLVGERVRDAGQYDELNNLVLGEALYAQEVGSVCLFRCSWCAPVSSWLQCSAYF